MTDKDKIAFKDALKQFCTTLVEQRIQTAKALIDNAQQAANNEEKSSAGDKYETARAMGHLEKDMHTRQMLENIKELAGLQQVTAHTLYHTVVTGAFIQCTGIAVFIAAGAGRQVFNGKAILFLSPGAPLAKLIMGKTAGHRFMFNGAENIIEEVF